MTRARWVLVAKIAGAALVVWLIAGVILAGRGTPPIPASSGTVVLNSCRTFNTHLRMKTWRFDCKRAELSPDQTVATIYGVRDGILYKKGKPYLRLQAQQVQFNLQTLDFTANGDVHITALQNSDGVKRTFETDFVSWNNASKMLYMPHQSIVKSGDQTLRIANVTVNFTTGQVQVRSIRGGFKAP